MKEIYTSSSPEETEELGRALATRLAEEQRMQAIVALRGGLGVGKTAFTRGFASAFGIKNVKSPTYTVVNEYRGEGCVLFHFDMYRTEGEDDLYSIGFDDYLARRAICLIEWSENIEEYLPVDRITVTIERLSTEDTTARRITVEEKEAEA